ncbi:ABC transporter substrate-binding protein [Thiocystis violacea]|uniref:ABC transporter substrate-binding protein n=1 Tax=Thiocystis violacea TaxID=13725 RepID=UPI001904BFA9|nr:ABC transporter substrate-binding protein [Thiocystis violacea]
MRIPRAHLHGLEVPVLARLARDLALVFLGIALSSCTQPAPLRVGVHPWIGYETLYLASQFGWLPEQIELHPGETMSDTAAALAAGTLDAAAITLDEMLLIRSKGVALSAVLVFDVSAGADMLLARDAYPSIAALRGRRVGVAPSALGRLVLARALASAGMALADVEILEVTLERQVAAWDEGRVDAVVTYAPTSARLERLGAHRVFDSRQMPDTIFDVLAVRRDRLDHPALPGLIRAHFRGIERLRCNREDALYRIAAHQGESFDAVSRALSEIAMPDLARNRTDLREGGALYRVAGELDRSMLAQGLVSAPDDLQDLVDDRFVAVRRDSAR